MKIFLPNVGFNPVMFVFTGWAGTFLLGVYLLKNPYRTRTMGIYLIIGLLIAAIGDGVAPLLAGAGAIGVFHDYLSFDIVMHPRGFVSHFSCHTRKYASKRKLRG